MNSIEAKNLTWSLGICEKGYKFDVFGGIKQCLIHKDTEKFNKFSEKFAAALVVGFLDTAFME